MNANLKCGDSAANQTVCRQGTLRRPAPLTVVLCGLGITASPLVIVNADNLAAYSDDTHAILQSDAEIRVVSGDFGYESYQLSQQTNGEPLVLDARNASFIVANSRNPNPTGDSDCESGPLPVNRYPFKVYDADETRITGGIINGEIPQESDWKPTYCNSAGIIFKNSADSSVDGLRMTSAWDGIRAGSGSPNLTISNSWISNVRDDAVENDFFLPLLFEDNLVDGAFQGISIHSGRNKLMDTGATVRVYGNVIRLREYLYKGRQQFGALFKNEDASPTSIIRNTVVAVDYNGGSTFSRYWKKSWSKIKDCSNNQFLWLSDEPIPDAVAMPPACFTVLTGAEARAEWVRARQNWIDCHPDVARTPADPASDAERCVANSFGGYSRHITDP